MHNPKLSLIRFSIHACSLLATVLLAGCQQAQRSSDMGIPATVATAVSMETLKEREAGVETIDEITELISLYQKMAAGGDAVAEAKTRAASLYLLLGAKFARSKADKRQYYRSAKELTVEAMSVDADFLAALQGGQRITDAAAGLEADMYEPLFLWATSIFYHFRDVASVPEKILFRKRLSEAARAIEVIVQKDPGWNDGCLQFSLGIYYLSVPGFAGGDRGKAIELINQGAGVSNKILLPRWGRAKYLSVATGDRRQFIDDLEWILNQDITEMNGPTIWNKYFIADSKELLASVDKLF